MMAKNLEAVWTCDQFYEWKAAVEEQVGVKKLDENWAIQMEELSNISVAQVSPDWAKAGYSFLLRFIKTLFDKLSDPAEVTSSYYGQNPFATWFAFKHYLAAAVANVPQATCHNQPFLWNTMPSKLEASWTMRIVEYNVQAGLVSVRNSQLPQARSSSEDADQPKRDKFVATFLNVQTGYYTEELARVLPPDVSNSVPACHNVTHIFLLQAAIFWICKNQGGDAKCDKDIIAQIGFAPSVWVKKESKKSMDKLFTTHLDIPLRLIDGHLMDGQANWDYSQLYVKLKSLGSKDKLKPDLFDHAIKQLKPPKDICNPRVRSLSDAWIHLGDMDAVSSNLLDIQQRALQVKQYGVALSVYSCYGIASMELFRYIVGLRELVASHTRAIQTEGLSNAERQAKADTAVKEFSKYKVGGSNSIRWDFD
ncbi:unnamed protein product [Cylindrotheca closterium]|nr:unnamed protein product [Cylindrotheca closterium]